MKQPNRVVLACLLALCTACSVNVVTPPPDGPGPLAGGARWKANEPKHYSYTYYRQVGMAGTSRASVEVRNNAVVKHRVITDSLDYLAEHAPPTVRALFTEIDAARDTADDVSVRYDEKIGYPRTVTVDPAENTSDDEVYFGVRDFRALP